MIQSLKKAVIADHTEYDWSKMFSPSKLRQLFVTKSWEFQLQLSMES